MRALSRDDLPGELLSLGLGDHRILCPKCSADRRRNRHVKCLSVTVDVEGCRWCCHHCGWSGAHKESEERVIKMMPQEPFLSLVEDPVELTKEDTADLSDAAAGWMAKRGISPSTCKKAGVFSREYGFPGKGRREGLWFPYINDKGEAYSHKIRTGDAKDFVQAGGANTFWGSEAIQPGGDLFIVEGEMDRLAIMEVGVEGVVSVPNGAPIKVSEGKITPEEDRRFKYVWSGKDMIDQAKRVVIAVDNDEPGKALGEELARRIGKARAWRIVWPDGCKDANDVLMNLGPDALRECLSKPEPWPIAGVYDAKHYEAGVRALFTGGLGKGLSTGYPNIDELYTVVPGHLCVVTGIPASGKSTWLNAVMVNMARQHGWRFAIWSTENTPEVLISLLAALKVEKPFFGEGDGPRITEAELDEALEWVNDHFVFLTGDGGSTTPESVIDRLKTAVLRYGVRGAVIDPASYLARPARDGDGGGSDSVGQMLEAFKGFAVSHDVACWLVAHPLKMRPNVDGGSSVPKGYEVSGCYDGETEVLTTSGWVSHDKVTMDHEVMCFDPATDRLTYQKPEQVHVYGYEGDMHHYSGAGLDLMVTPNHRMVVKPKWLTPFERGVAWSQGVHNLPRESWSVIRSEELPRARWALPMAAPFAGGGEEAELFRIGEETYKAKPFWWFAGFWAAEGCVQSSGLSVCQAEENSSTPRSVMDELGLQANHSVTHYRPEEKPMWTARIFKREHPMLTSWMVDRIGEGCQNKRVPRDLWEAGREEKASFLAGMVFGDGNETASAWRICLTSKGMVDDLQRLAYELGLWAHVRKDVRVDSMKPHHKDRWTVTIRFDRRERVIQMDRNLKMVPYKGKVYCLTVPGGAYVTRRNGKAIICGNSASWYNRPDFGITVHRPAEARHMTEIHVWKVRFAWTGQEGRGELFHDRTTGRYDENPFPVTHKFTASCFTPQATSTADPWDFT